MKALVFRFRTNSLYSIRIPFTWQSALTYPILPPSAVIGLLANAMQRFRNDSPPLRYLELIENDILWAGSRLLGPCVIKSYTTSAITKWEDLFPWKFTNALGRQFAHSVRLEAVAVFEKGHHVSELLTALKTTPLTCGDSESPITVEEAMIRAVNPVNDEMIETSYPIPWTDGLQIISGEGKIFIMHERCRKISSSFPLKAYVVPLLEHTKILYPSRIAIFRGQMKCVYIEEVDTVVLDSGFLTAVTQQSKRKRRKS